jgi:hypothetical protein
MEPLKFFLCRVSNVSHDVVSVHGYVWANDFEQAKRITLDARKSAITRPKGRPPRDTRLDLFDENTLRTKCPTYFEAAAAPVTSLET